MPIKFSRIIFCENSRYNRFKTLIAFDNQERKGNQKQSLFELTVWYEMRKVPGTI